ncbi:MAG: NAD(+) kinase [Gammaproteobacteria bacterium]|nr:NAD(+) kinase [Gammaproteobacteria bacterium]
MTPFKHIGLVGRPGHAGVVDSLERVLDFLQRRNLVAVLDTQTAGLVDGRGDIHCDGSELGERCDLVVVVGGDGSMLHVAKAITAAQLPVIGINRGKLGFLTDIPPSKIEAGLEEVLSGNFSVDRRFLLEANKRESDGSLRALGAALNDVVLHPGNAAQMIEFELFVDGRFVYSLASDGLIVATPTGSTAYSLSAGGPIMHPTLNAIVLVPMYPHSLNSRPIVVDGDSEIRLVVSATEDLRPQISCDGQEVFSAKAGDEIVIRKSASSLKLIHPLEHSFYGACRSKLGWGNRLEKED